MSPVSRRDLERYADKILEATYPSNLVEPTRLDVVRLLDRLEKVVGVVLAVEDLEQGEEGHLNPKTRELVIDTRVYQAALGGGRRARFTCAHEVGHIPHMKQATEIIRERGAQLARRLNVNVPPYRDPEWQAHGIGSALLMPRQTVPAIYRRGGIAAVADFYLVSETAARVRIDVLRTLGVLS